MTDKQEIVTSRIISIALLQYSMLIPAMNYIDSSILVAITGSILLLILLFTNHSFTISLPVFCVGLLLTLLLLLKALIGHADLKTLFYIFLLVFPTLMLYLFPYDSEEILRFSIKLSRIAFVVLFWIPFSSQFYSSYMRFGYGMLPIVLFVYINLVHYHKDEPNYKGGKTVELVADLGIFFAGCIEILFFGSRGAVFAIILFVGLDRIVYSKERVIINSLFILTAAFAYLNIGRIFAFFDVVLNRFHISSYSIMKFERQLERGFAAASSSRNIIYANSIELIKKAPFLGNPISVDESGGAYVHNLFLQVAQDMGIVVMFMLVVFVLYSIVQIGKKLNSKSDRLFVLTLFSISIGRLMFSSTIWRRPEFWMLVCFVVNIKRIANKHKSNDGHIKNHYT